MAEVASRELRNDTAGVLRRAETGEVITIAVRGKPVAQLSPAHPGRSRAYSVTRAGVLDTSVFIANEGGSPFDASAVPEETATTVSTVAELTAGIPAAGSTEVRARRLAALNSVSNMVALPVDERAARVGDGFVSTLLRQDDGWGSTTCGSRRSRSRSNCQW